MYYELYIDIFFLENFMMDSILLLFVRSVFGKKTCVMRTFAAGMIGAMLSCIVIVAKMPEGVKRIGFYLIVPVIMLWIGIRLSGILQFAEAIVLLYFSAGCIAGIVQLFRPYIRMMSLVYGIAIAGYFEWRIIWQLLTRYRYIQKQCCQVILYEEATKWYIQAMIDTGNMLQDPVEQKPVHIISKKLAEKIYGQKIVAELLNYSFYEEERKKWLEKKVHYIPCQTIQGVHMLPVLTMKKMIIRQETEIEIQMPLIGISIMEELSGQRDYQMIVNAQSIGGSKHGCRDNEHTAV